ncbi:UNVERIFIED_ORG: hypothetical protein CLV66_120100 [Actinomadura viridilutea]
MAGVYLLPTTVLMLLVSPLAGGLVRTTSAATMVAAGSVAAAILASETVGGTGVPTGHAYQTSFAISAVAGGLAALSAAWFGWRNRSRAASPSAA